MDLQLTGINKRYGSFHAVQYVTLHVRQGEFCVLLGPSGCGKTTTLRCIAGLETPDAGRISIGNRAVFDSQDGTVVPPEQRGLGMVFQSYAIWPHMTVFENVAYGLSVRRRPREVIRDKVEQALALVGLKGLAERPATNLSGGQMQRVALARSLALDPALLLLDEPLSNLDLKLREHLRFELKEIQLKTGLTTVYVTHDQTEAVALADRIVIMNGGQIVQEGGPEELFARPANTFVADFLGSANILPARVLGPADDGAVMVEVDGGLMAQGNATGPFTEGQIVAVAIRSEDFKVTRATSPGNGFNRWQAQVEVPNFLGTQTRYALNLAGHRVYATVLGSHVEYPAGTVVTLEADSSKVMVLKE